MVIYIVLLTIIKKYITKIDSKFSEMAQHVMEMLRYSEQMRDDCKIIYLTHSENVGDALNTKEQIKTIGKVLSEKVTLEGLFTSILFTRVVPNDNGLPSYQFITNNDGTCIAKTPMGMFKDLYIDNDLQEVINVMDAYYEEE